MDLFCCIHNECMVLNSHSNVWLYVMFHDRMCVQLCSHSSLCRFYDLILHLNVFSNSEPCLTLPLLNFLFAHAQMWKNCINQISLNRHTCMKTSEYGGKMSVCSSEFSYSNLDNCWCLIKAGSFMWLPELSGYQIMIRVLECM